ncbi:MAG: glycosyltransferase family 4 protein [Paracoccaceae bacterium]
MSRGRIVHLIDGLEPGGAEFIMAAYAPKLVSLGFEVQVVSLKPPRNQLIAERLAAAGIALEIVPIDRLRHADQLLRLRSVLQGIRPDLVHAHLEFASILASTFKRATHAPLVATLHTTEVPRGWKRSSARLWLMYRSLDLGASAVICLTQLAKQHLRQNTLRRVPIEVLPNGIELALFDVPPGLSRAQIRGEFGIPDTAPLIVSVAVLRAGKGIDLLVDAFATLRQTVGDAHLLIVGDGPERPLVMDRIARHDLGDVVHMAGFRKDVADILRASDVFVLPTLMDALPTVIMEAMAARLPIVASETGGIPEMIEDGREGLLVPPGNVDALAKAMIRICTQPDFAQELASAGRHRVEESFFLPRQVERLADLYDRLISTSPQKQD